MDLVAVEPVREVAAWLRAEGGRLGLALEVHADLGGARARLEAGGVRHLAGYLGAGEGAIPQAPSARGPVIVPFRAETPGDRRLRWSLLLGALRGAARGREGANETAWIDGRCDEEMEARHRALIAGLSGVFIGLSRRDPTVRDHSFRVGFYAARIGGSLGLTPLEIRLLRLGGWVHDVGKIRVRADILRKSGALAPDERRNMRRHPAWGSLLIAARRAEEEILGIVRSHHERLDGGGYPDGLSGGAIPILARVLAVADTYDAMTSARPYRPTSDHRATLREILDCSGSQFDPDVVRALLVARLDRAAPRIHAA